MSCPLRHEITIFDRLGLGNGIIPFPPFHLAYFQALRSRQLKCGVPAHSSTAPMEGAQWHAIRPT